MLRRITALVAVLALAVSAGPAAAQGLPVECPVEFGLPAPDLFPEDGGNLRPSLGIYASADWPDWPPAGRSGDPDIPEIIAGAAVVRRPDGKTWGASGYTPTVQVPGARPDVYELAGWVTYRYPSGLECRVTRTSEFTVAPLLATPRAALRHVKRTIARVKTAARRERIDLLKTFITDDLEWSRDTWLDDVRQDRAKQAWERRLQQMGAAVALADRFPGNRFYLAKLEASAKRFGAQTLRYAAALTRRGGPDRPS